METIKRIKQNKKLLLLFVMGILIGVFMPKYRLVLNAGLLFLIFFILAVHDLRKRKAK